MDNGFCELIFNFLDPIALGGFVADLLKVFELEDFAQYVAIKQVYDVLTQCPTYGGKSTNSAIGIIDAIVTCPESFNASEIVLSTYRNAPVADNNGAEMYLGYKQVRRRRSNQSKEQEAGDLVLFFNAGGARSEATKRFEYCVFSASLVEERSDGAA